jgi:hypothetical protein
MQSSCDWHKCKDCGVATRIQRRRQMPQATRMAESLLGVRGPQATFKDARHCDETRNATIARVSLPPRSDHQLMGGSGSIDRSFGQRCMCEGASSARGLGFWGARTAPCCCQRRVSCTTAGAELPNKISTSSLPLFPSFEIIDIFRQLRSDLIRSNNLGLEANNKP